MNETEHSGLAISHSPYYTNNKGVAAIEFALIAPLALLMFFGIFETGQALLLNQKVYAASHMTSDLLARKAILDDRDLVEAYAAAQMIIEPFDTNDLEIDIVGVRFDAAQAPERVWQRAFPGTAAADGNLFNSAGSLGQENEGVIIVEARYDYSPTFLNTTIPFIGTMFSAFEMSEISVLRGRINSCIGLNDAGVLLSC